MLKKSNFNGLAGLVMAWLIGTGVVGFSPVAQAAGKQARQDALAKPDLSGRKRIGHASVYAGNFAGKKMADGTKMTIRDRGPHVKGRILDVSPATAHQLGITKHKGVAQVQVVPIAPPKTNDSAKSGIPPKKVKAKKATSAGQRQ